MTKQTIGEFLATLRKANGYTQQEIADRLRISNRTLSGWECDKVLPDILLLPALAEIYGVTVDEILAGELKQSEEIKISHKSEWLLLQNKFAKFCMQSAILITYTIVSIILLFIGCVKEINVKFVGVQWGLFVFYGGLTGCVICVSLLFILWKYAENTVDNEFDGYGKYILFLRKKMSISLCVISALFFVGASLLVLGGVPNSLYYEYIPEIPVQAIIFLAVSWFIVPLALILTAFLIWKKAIAKWSAEDSKRYLKQNRKYFVKVMLFCLIPVVVAMVLLLPIWTTTRSLTIYENGNGEEFVEYMECYCGKYIPLSETEKEAVIGEEDVFTDDCLGRYKRDGVFVLYFAEKSDNWSRSGYEVHRHKLENGLTFYNLRYIDDSYLNENNPSNLWFGNYITSAKYEFEAFGNGARFVRKFVYDYSTIPNMLGAIILLIDAAVGVSLCFVKYLKRSVIKL